MSLNMVSIEMDLKGIILGEGHHKRLWLKLKPWNSVYAVPSGQDLT
jgi:hypothetical protein